MNTKYRRRATAQIKVASVGVGSDYPISIQSMTNTDTHDIDATYRQVMALSEFGCDIIRISAPTLESCETFRELKRRGVKAPLVADIHFNYKIALAAIEAGADKIRINPGNIGSRDKIREVAIACKERRIPIRIGVNSGSLEEEILLRHGAPSAGALAESALWHASLLRDMDFSDIVISVKSSDVRTMIEANRILAENTNYPLHLGVTEAGAGAKALVKSSIGVGTLLSDGIGDTIRVSLTDNPLEEIKAARQILSALSLSGTPLINIISCPTCGRTKIDLISLSRDFEARLESEGLDTKGIRVALMGCAVNGPGEAREADIGIAAGIGEALLFKKGVVVRKIKEDAILDELISEIKNME